MDNLTILKAVRDPAIEIMKESKILASFTISNAMYVLNKMTAQDATTLLNANNVMAKAYTESSYNTDFVLLDGTYGRGKRYKTYTSVKSGLIDWLMGFKSSYIQGVWDIHTICQKLKNTEFNLTNLKPFIDAYQLDKIDDIGFEELFPTGKTVVEVPVSESFANKIQKLSGYNGTLPELAPVTKEIKYKPEKEERILNYTAGERCIVYGANLYESAISRTPIRAVTGNVWLYDGKQINGRYAVVTIKGNVGKKGEGFIDGYIKKSELK